MQTPSELQAKLHELNWSIENGGVAIKKFGALRVSVVRFKGEKLVDFYQRVLKTDEQVKR